MSIRIELIASAAALLTVCSSNDEKTPLAARDVSWLAPLLALPASEQLASDLVMAPIGRN